MAQTCKVNRWTRAPEGVLRGGSEDNSRTTFLISQQKHISDPSDGSQRLF